MPTHRLLIVDDDTRLTTMLADYLRAGGYVVERAGDLESGRRALAQGTTDALVLDLMLPDGDGTDLCRELRSDAATRGLPILMLTARGDPMDRVLGLEMGADDYLTKPFEPRELLARIKALLRRAALGPSGAAGSADGATADAAMRFGRLEIDVDMRQARVDGKVCELTAYQFDLLLVLARAPGRVLSRDQIMDALKGHPLEAFDRSIDVHVSRIRAAIEDDAKNPQRILTVRGVGYVFAKKQDGDTH